MNRTKRVTYTLPKVIITDLEMIAKETGLKKSTIITLGVTEWIKKWKLEQMEYMNMMKNG